ncbi:MAG: hypothetical protein JWN27_4674 [Candidatus Eremiobacteraeota bacterium]|nr:hypothetical protein [Candidatus Eremiobacteraeota bacterium]
MIAEKTASPSGSRVMAGHRPTGRLHLGHLLGTLGNCLSETAVEAILCDGNERARTVAAETMSAVRSAPRLRDE